MKKTITYAEVTKSEVFTPLSHDRKTRLRFNAQEVLVLEGADTLSLRRKGAKGRVQIEGHIYLVIGCACSIPHCNCDAYIKEV